MWPYLIHDSSCGCTICTPSTNLCYAGPNLPNTGIQNNDTLSVALQKIDNSITAGSGGSQDLQSVLTLGGTAFFPSYEVQFSDGYSGLLQYDPTIPLNQSSAVVQISSVNLNNQYNNKSTTISAVFGDFLVSQTNDLITTNIKINPPIENTSLFFPAKTIAGDYNLATTDEINLQTVIDNGNVATVDYSGYFGIQLNGSPDISTVISPFGITASTSGNTVYYNSTGITFKGKVNRFPNKLNVGEYTIVTTPISSYTVSTLPLGQLNDIAVVTDATSPTYLGALTGGGSVVTPVWHNGTIWVAR